MAVLLPAFVTLLLLLSEVSAGGHEHAHAGGHDKDHDTAASSQTPITVHVNSALPSNLRGPSRTYSTYVVKGGLLLGGLRRLQETSSFRFTYSEDPDYGLFVESVNGLPGVFNERIYWKMTVEKAELKSTITPDVGIGCYIPSANDTIIFTYTMY